MPRRLAVVLAAAALLAALAPAAPARAAAGPYNLTAAREAHIRDVVVWYAKVQVSQREPYCWGGTGPNCFDCSGLIVAAYRYAGIAIPRTSYQQRAWTRKTSLAGAEPGDILHYNGHSELFYKPGYAISATYTGGPPVNIHRIRTRGLLSVGKVVY